MFYEDFLIKYVNKPYRSEFKKQMSKWANSSKLYGTWWTKDILFMIRNQVIDDMFPGIPYKNYNEF